MRISIYIKYILLFLFICSFSLNVNAFPKKKVGQQRWDDDTIEGLTFHSARGSFITNMLDIYRYTSCIYSAYFHISDIDYRSFFTIQTLIGSPKCPYLTIFGRSQTYRLSKSSIYFTFLAGHRLSKTSIYLTFLLSHRLSKTSIFHHFWYVLLYGQ